MTDVSDRLHKISLIWYKSLFDLRRLGLRETLEFKHASALLISGLEVDNVNRMCKIWGISKNG